MSKFHVGQKVKIATGGWGFHPHFTGKIVTIHSVETMGGDSRYTTEETLTDSRLSQPHKCRVTAVHEKSFEAINADSTADAIRAINERIAICNTAITALQSSIDTEEQAKAKLNKARQVLVATLLRELDV